jgi:hypothetical protein
MTLDFCTVEIDRENDVYGISALAIMRYDVEKYRSFFGLVYWEKEIYLDLLWFRVCPKHSR